MATSHKLATTGGSTTCPVVSGGECLEVSHIVLGERSIR